jgi:hypothetical protein
MSAMLGERSAHADTPIVPSSIATKAVRFMMFIVNLTGRAES